MGTSRTPSPQAAAILQALGSQPSDWRYGYDLVRELGIKSGSLYPILILLAERGLLETRWETDGPLGRPPRHMYRLSSGGLEYVRADVRSVASPTRRLRPLEA